MSNKREIADYWITRCEEYYTHGEYTDALKCAEKAVNLDPGSASVYFARGNANDGLNRYEDAIADFDQVIEIGPNDSAAFYNRGNAKSNLGRLEEAITDFNRAIELDSYNAAAYQNRGIAKDELGSIEEAVDDYNEAINIEPNYAAAFYNRGVAKHKLNRYDEAISDFDKAISIDPSNAAAFYNCANSKRSIGLYEDAIVDYISFLEVAPDVLDEQIYLNWAKKQIEELEKAIKTGATTELPTEAAPQRLDEITGRVPEAVMFFDLIGSTEIMNNDGVEIYLRHFFQLKKMAEEIFRKWDVTYIKSLGDGFMAVAKDCESIVHSAVDLMAGMDELNKGGSLEHKLAARIGIDFGQVTIDVHNDRFGKCVVIAARLEAIRKEGFKEVVVKKSEFPSSNRIFISEKVNKLLTNGFHCRKVGKLELKSFHVDHTVFCVDWEKGA